jgi:hypothetical protein
VSCALRRVVSIMIRPGLGPSFREAGKDAVEDTEADDAVAERLVRSIAFGGILPLQAVADDVDDSAKRNARGGEAPV